MNILVAIDGSAYTQRMTAFVAEHANWFGAPGKLTVLHCVVAVPPHVASRVGTEACAQYYAQEADKVIAPVRAHFKERGVDAEFAWMAGHPSEAIAEKAESGGFDLIVMGSAGHGELMNLVLGSVATQVMARCRTPVLLVR